MRDDETRRHHTARASHEHEGHPKFHVLRRGCIPVFDVFVHVAATGTARSALETAHDPVGSGSGAGGPT